MVEAGPSKMQENDNLTSFFTLFEQALSINEEPRNRWAKILPAQLTGTARHAFEADVPPEHLDDYDQVKSILLSAMGDTPQRAADEW